MNSTIRWGLLGTGKIARAFANALKHARLGRAMAVASRSRESADAFAREFSIPRAYPDYQALLHDEEVDAVYISLIHPLHAQWALRCAEAGKHCLCEKPITMNHREAENVIHAFDTRKKFLMEAFMYRCHPQTTQVIEMIQKGVIGELKVISATFSFLTEPYDHGHRVLSRVLGGGGILDVGCYCVSMARLVAGVACGMPHAEPLEVHGCACLGPTEVDEYSVAIMKFPGDILARLSCGIRLAQENRVILYGTEGHLTLPTPWGPGLDGQPSKIIIHKRGNFTPHEVEVVSNAPLFTLEADSAASHILAGRRQALWPQMTWADSLGNMKTLDLWREDIGLRYDADNS